MAALFNFWLIVVQVVTAKRAVWRLTCQHTQRFLIFRCLWHPTALWETVASPDS